MATKAEGSPMAGLEPGAGPLVGVADGRDRWGNAPSGRLGLHEIGMVPQVSVRVDADGQSGPSAAVAAAIGVGLPAEPGTTAREDGVVAVWLGPGEWLLVTPGRPGAEVATVLCAALADWHGSAIDVSGQRTFLRVQGSAASLVLAHGCALDLHPEVFRAGACAQTLMAGAVVLLLRDGPDAFLVGVRSSFAEHLAAWLDDAAAAEYWEGSGWAPQPPASDAVG